MRKKSWKKVLSAILASAMLFTAVPANLTMTVQAQEPGVEDTMPEDSDALTVPVDDEQTVDVDETAENGQNPAGGGTNVGSPAEGTEDVGDTTEDGTEDDGVTGQTPGTETGDTENSDGVGNSDSSDNNEAEGGEQDPPKGDATTGHQVDGKNVTFTYVGDADTSTVAVSGTVTTPPWQESGDKALFLDEGENDVFSKTVQLEPGNYEYKFVVNGSYEEGQNRTFTVEEEAGTEDSMRDLTIQVKVGDALPAKLNCFYAAGSTAAAETEVEYSLTAESQTAGVTLGGSVGTQTVTVPNNVLATGAGTGEITLTAKKTDANISCTVTVQLIEDLQKDDRLTATPGAGQVTFQFFAPKPVTKLVNVKGSWNWNTVTAMEYDAASGYWSAVVKMPPGEYRYGFDVYEKIGGTSQWYNGEYGTQGNSGVTVTEGSGEVSPVIEGKKVTFIYENSAAISAYVAGSMNGWQDTLNSDEYKMTKNAENGKWELTKEMSAGRYEYKYIYFLEGDPGEKWAADPLNPDKTEGDDPNSIFVVEGLADSGITLNRMIGKAELDSTLKCFGEDGASTDAVVEYSLSEETKKAPYKDAVKVTTENKKSYVSITEDFPKDVSEFTLTATDKDKNTSKVTVTIIDKAYNYTIYYYDRDESHRSVDASELWIWNEVKKGETSADSGKVHLFDEVVELADGNTWLKAEVSLGYTSLGIIPKVIGGKDVWTWQETNRYYTNTDESENVTLYIVSNDSAKVYTELPEIQEVRDRYLVVEYTRETKQDGHWQFYTWNSGFGSDVWVPFETREDGTLIAKVPVKQGLESISFCLAREEGGDNWAEKDGNDYTCPIPADQDVVKVKMEEGKGITYTYPYNTGYEIDAPEGQIHFYYRDDEAFLAGSEGGYENLAVDIIVPTTDEGAKEASVLTEDMMYNEEEQRYEYVLEQLTAGDHYYRYGRQKTADAETEYVLDAFNELKKIVDEKEYSVLEYEILDVSMEAVMQNSTMDYNDNNVLTIKVEAKDKDGNPIKDTGDVKIVDRATVDLSEVGGGITEIDPELLAISIAVKEGTSEGEKTLPITIYDKYNNGYETSAKVNVSSRSKGSDFDWDEAVVYFAVTDRFFDGNSSNNEGGVPGSYDKTTNNGLNSSYHGGDFAGLTQKLDYLQDLGVNTIWITPIVENQTVANSVDDPTVTQAWGYTGYWTKDFTKIDAHLGTEAEFSALLDAAHAKGMKVMVDVVLNHTGYGDEITNYYNTNFKNEDGEVIRMLRGDDEVVPGSDQMSSLSGLPDFRTEDPEVRELIVEWQSNWISRYPIDYYRVDTVKHVDDTTWSAFKNALTEINPDFKMIGEWAGAGYGTDTGMLNAGRMDALLDFDFPAQAANFVTGDLTGVEGFLAARNGAIDNAASLGAFLSNHDQQGFVRRLMKEKGKSEDEAKQLALVAASLQLTAKGQVYIYYGEEIGVSDGEENYPYQTNRRDFDWSKVTDDNKALAHYKTMLSIRDQYSELLAKGSRAALLADNERGLDVFTRSYGGQTLIVALNIHNNTQEYVITGQTPGAVFTDRYSGSQYVADAGGNVAITIPAASDGGTVVLAAGEGVDQDIELTAGMHVKSIPDQTYTGLSIKLSEEDLQVYHGTAKLVSGRDYTVRYKNNKAVGTATVSIIGRGNYQETETAQFNILPKNITDGDVAVSYHEYMVANGKVQKPLLNITYNNNKIQTKYYQAEYYQLDETGKRISEALKGVKEIGTYEMVITGKTNFTGTVVKTIQVKETGTYMSQTSVTINGLTKNATPYTGKAIEPAVEVKKGGAAVEKDCYTVTYRNNVEVGTAQVIVTGVADKGYFGSVTKNFNITGTALSSVAQVDTEGWQAKVAFDLVKGKAEQPNALLKVKKGKNVTLTKGTDYTVSYTNNTKPGTATVLFTGKGQYTGVVKKTFKILPITLQQSDLGKNLKVTVAETAPFSKKGAKAAVSVIFKNRKLTENVDYKLTYSANKAVTKENTKTMPSVTIKGMGAFTGTIKGADELKFSIVKADLNDPAAGISVRVSDVVYADQAGKFMAEPEVKEADGTKLVKGSNKDYVVKYFVTENGTETEKTASDKLEAGTNVKVVVSATENSNYTGETSREYRVVKASIGTANVVVNAQTYTGKAVTLKEEDFKKVKVGNDLLKMGEDYEIVPGSYKDNVNKGNATVTIRGIGNYGGTRQVTYRISSYMMRWWWNLFG